MKKIKHITIFIFALLSLASCAYDDFNYSGENEKTAAAKLVYDETERTIQRYIEILSLSQTIDKYLHSEDKERDSIKYYHLAGYDILETDTIISVRDGNQGRAWTIIRNSTDSLNTPSTEWRIEGDCMFFNIPRDGFIITTQATVNTWHIKVTDSYSQDYYNQNYDNNYQNYYNNSNTISNAYLNIRMETDRYIITMAGDKAGKIDATTGDLFNTSFKITSPIELSMYRFVKGKMDMEVERNYATKDSISAEIRGNGERIAISFRGITEMW